MQVATEETASISPTSDHTPSFPFKIKCCVDHVRSPFLSGGRRSRAKNAFLLLQDHGDCDVPRASALHVSDPGRKQRICVLPLLSMYGHTTAPPNLLGPLTTA